MTLRSGNCESVLIRLSVRPSPRYSLLGSAVALTKGKTAIELIFCACGRPRNKNIEPAITSKIAAMVPEIKYIRDRLGTAAAGTDEEEPEAMTAPPAAEVLDTRPES